MPDDTKKQEEEATKKTVDVATKGVLDYYTGGKGGQIMDTAKKVPLAGKTIDKAEKKAAKRLNQATGGKAGKISKKLNDSGALDMADKALSLNSGSKGINKPQMENSGKNLLNNNSGISKPSSSDLNKDNNNDRFKEQIDKNNARKLSNSVGKMLESSDSYMKEENESENKDDKNKKDNKDNKNKDKSDLDNNDKDKDKKDSNSFSLFGKMSFKTKVILISSIGAFSLLVIILIVLSTYISNFLDLIGVGSAGEASIVEAAGVDTVEEKLYKRVLDKQKKDQENGKTYDADLVISVYHVLSIRKNGFTPSSFTDAFIDEVVSMMFPDNCGDSCSYDEATFKKNLKEKFFPKYLAKDECSDATDEVFEYLQAYKELIGYVENISTNSSCGGISLTSTTLSKSEFVSRLKSYKNPNSSTRVMMANAEKIYDISIQNNFNPELVVIRANLENSPGGSTNNHWGIGCPNRGGCHVSYKTIDEGILGYIKVVQGYGVSDLLDVYYVKHYAYIGNQWYRSRGDNWGDGGCIYFPYVSKYLSDSRRSVVEKACNSGNEIPTTDEDQLAYSKYQIEKSVIVRQNIFGIGNDQCDENTQESVGSGEGAKVASYAIKTFDSFLYSQPLRMTNNHVDCSSMVWRSYMHFGIQIGGTSNWAADSGGIKSWCLSNGKMVDKNSIQSGDVLIRSGHVGLYVGNNQTFEAHGQKGYYATHPDAQVSVSNYYASSWTYVCRPLKK